MPQLRAHAMRATPASRSEPTRSDGAPCGKRRIHARPCLALRCRRSCASCAGYPSLSNQAEVGEESQQLRASMKDAKRWFTDDTGWRINGESASMMGSDTDEATVYKSVYVIATRRSASSSHRIRAA